MRFFPVFNHWLHLSSVVLWIGGLAFQVFIMAPLLQTGDPSYAFLKKISERFRFMIGPLMILLAVTGGINLHFRRAGHEELPTGYISALGMKVFLLAVVASLYFLDLLQSRQADQQGKKQENEPALSSQNYLKLSLAIGAVIIFLASMLRHWKF